MYYKLESSSESEASSYNNQGDQLSHSSAFAVGRGSVPIGVVVAIVVMVVILVVGVVIVVIVMLIVEVFVMVVFVVIVVVILVVVGVGRAGVAGGGGGGGMNGGIGAAGGHPDPVRLLRRLGLRSRLQFMAFRFN